MLGRSLPELALRLAVAWFALAIAAAFIAPQCIFFARPVLQIAFEQITPGLIATMYLQSGAGGHGDVVMVMQATAPLAIADGLALSPWVKISESINAGHDMVPAIVLFSVLFAWPYRSIKEGAAALALGVPACAALLTWTIAVHFAGLLELAIQRTAIQHGLARPEPFVLTQMLFFEAGGQWMLALVLAFAVASWVTRAHATRVRPISI